MRRLEKTKKPAIPIIGRRTVVILLGLLAAVLIPIIVGGESSEGPGDPWRKIAGKHLDERFSGMTFFGSIPSELAEPSAFGIRAGRIMYYAPTGNLLTAGGWNRAISGSWRIKGDAICHFGGPAPKDYDCWKVYEGESEVLLWRSEKDQWVGTLSPGNQACQQVTEQSGCTKATPASP